MFYVGTYNIQMISILLGIALGMSIYLLNRYIRNLPNTILHKAKLENKTCLIFMHLTAVKLDTILYILYEINEFTCIYV